MVAKPPTLLRWTETAEAARVCTLALLQRELDSPVACLVEVAAGFCVSTPRKTLAPRQLGWFRWLNSANNARRRPAKRVSITSS
jgi:hypothetical protein